MSIVKILPDFRSGGGAQMALDAGLLETVDEVIARRYTWAPPALSIGKFQELQVVPGLPFEIVRRPSGGRAVLHGEEFEWSFAVAFPPGVPSGGPRAAVDVGGPYGIVAAAFAGALKELGVTLDGSGETPYQRSALCFAGALRYDICARGEKIVAIAQAKRGGADAGPRLRPHAPAAGRARPRGRGPGRRAVAGRGSGGRRRGARPGDDLERDAAASRGRPAPGGGRMRRNA